MDGSGTINADCVLQECWIGRLRGARERLAVVRIWLGETSRTAAKESGDAADDGVMIRDGIFRTKGKPHSAGAALGTMCWRTA